MGAKTLFVVWYSYSPRAKTLAADLEGRVSFQYESRLKARWLLPVRYLFQGWNTWRLLDRERPAAVLVQAPPTVAPLVVAMWCALRGKDEAGCQRTPYVMDCHTGVFRDERFAWPLLRILARRAAATLVTSRTSLDLLRRWGARGIMLDDGLPALSPAAGAIGSSGDARMAVIVTFSEDEPVAKIFTAAGQLPGVTFYVTGDHGRAPAKLLARKPHNVVLTGFLRDGAYTALLKNVHGLVVLTNSQHAVNSGAYEAVVAAKPAVVSDWPEMRRRFTRGFIHVRNTPEDIAAGVGMLLDNWLTLVDDVIALRHELVRSRAPALRELVALLPSAASLAPAPFVPSPSTPLAPGLRRGGIASSPPVATCTNVSRHRDTAPSSHAACRHQ